MYRPSVHRLHLPACPPRHPPAPWPPPGCPCGNLGGLASSQPPVFADPRAKGYVATKAKEVVEAWAGLAKKQMCTKEEFEKGACGEGPLHLATKYFESWNAHDSAGLEALFSDRVSLVDWEQRFNLIVLLARSPKSRRPSRDWLRNIE